MSWDTRLIAIPEQWIDAAKTAVAAQSWVAELLSFTQSFQWTDIHHQTFKSRLNDPFEAQARYCRFLVGLPLSWGVRAVLWAVEPHPKGHGSHIHSLWNESYSKRLQRLRKLSPNTARAIPALYRVVKRRSAASIGWSRLWPIDEESCQVALRYTLKYIVKDIRKLMDPRRPIPLPHEPMEREACWGIWTKPA